MKKYLVTYKKPGQDDLPSEGLMLHEPDCRYLKPTAARPYTGSREATKEELAKHPKCKVC
jgi:hypothetical protein